MRKLIVKAAPGLTCPREEHPRRYITDAEWVEVPASAYYRRRLADGSLVQAPEGTTPMAIDAGAESESKPAKKKGA
jgi:hypothetical protein